MVPTDPRPVLSDHLDALLAAVLVELPELNTLRAENILLVAGDAYGTGAASVRPLGDVASSVVVDGHSRFVEICLRPKFFHTGDGPSRLATLIHEILHVDPHDPSSLLESNRHVHRSHQSLNEESISIATRVLNVLRPDRCAVLMYDGEGLFRQWMNRPVSSTKSRQFDDRDLFLGPIRMVTNADRRIGL